jgi:putative N6-adenine-specific DNA methylase
MKYFATIARGLEDLGAKELESLGAINVEPEYTGINFDGELDTLYRINLHSRLIYKVLMPIATVKCFDREELYQSIKAINWSLYLTPEQTLAVKCTGKNSKLNHTHFTALEVKNAITDQQQQQFGQRSSVNIEQPDIPLNIHIQHSRAIVSLDSSGMSLHRRGYRPAMGLAPLKETLAAAIIELTGWDGTTTLYDPLCGSGTLLIEAACRALVIAPNIDRPRFAFQNWPNFDSKLWQQIGAEAFDQEREKLDCLIIGHDRDRTILEQAEANVNHANLQDHIQLSQQNFAAIEPPTPQGILVCNPPYGVRLGEEEELKEFYKEMGDILKQRFKGWTAFILSGNKNLTKCVGLRTSARFPLFNGTIPCTLLKYELY